MDRFFSSFSVYIIGPPDYIDLYADMRDTLELLVKERDELRTALMEYIKKEHVTDFTPGQEDR